MTMKNQIELLERKLIQAESEIDVLNSIAEKRQGYIKESLSRISDVSIKLAQTVRLNERYLKIIENLAE